jgi:hypothetical protein
MGIELLRPIKKHYNGLALLALHKRLWVECGASHLFLNLRACNAISLLVVLSPSPSSGKIASWQ